MQEYTIKNNRILLQIISPQIPFAADVEENQQLLFHRLQTAALCLDKTCTNIECSMVSI